MYTPILTKEQALQLDNDLCVKGYLVGIKDQQPDYTQKDQAYWHGYLNGQVDCGKMKPSLEQQALAKDWVRKGKFN